MKDWNDAKIQELLDKGLSSSDPDFAANQNSDLEVYRLLFEALKVKPEMQLPHNFSAKVAKKIMTKQPADNSFQLYALIAATFILFIAGTCFYLLSTNMLRILQPLSSLFEYKYAFLFGIVSIATMQLLDQKLLRRV